MKNNVFFGVFLVSMLSFLCIFNRGFAQSYTAKERVYWLSMIWKDVSTKYCNPQCLDSIRWDSLYTDYIPLAVEAEDDCKYYSLLERFMAMVNDGHTELNYQKYIFGDKRFDYLPVDIEMVAGRFYVAAIEKSKKDSIPLGSEILSVNNMVFLDYMKKYAFPYVSANTMQNRQRKALGHVSRGIKNDSLLFQIRTPMGERKEAILRYNMIANGVKKKDMIGIHSSNVINYRRTDSYLVKDSFKRDFFYFRFDAFSNNLNIEEMMRNQKESVLKSKYIIIDLRYNSGGNELKADSLLMCFLDIDTLKTYASLTRVDHAYYAAQGLGYPNYREYYHENKVDTLPMNCFAKKNLPLFNQPLFVLVSDRTLSAAEDFLIALKMHFPKRAILIGSDTGGTTGAPFVRRLSHHGVYYRICARKPLLPEGFFDNGIHPDYYYQPDINDFMTVEGLFNYVSEIYVRYYENK